MTTNERPGLIVLALSSACLAACTAPTDTQSQSAAVRAPSPVRLSTVDDAVTGYGTFQSHDQKVVETRDGIFMTYVKTPYEGATWRLMRSVDDGATFSLLHEATATTHPPALEAASNGVLYLVHSDDGAPCSPAHVYRFAPRTGFAPERLATLCGGAAMKFSLLLDEPRGQLYYVAHTTAGQQPLRFYRLALDGTLLADVQLAGSEPVAAPTYPSLSLSDGVLYVAWSTQYRGGDNGDYDSIHVARSADGGHSWFALDGTPLVAPFIGDSTGQATEVTTADERPCSTWLASYVVSAGKAHFFYFRNRNANRPACVSAPTMRYRRFDAVTGAAEADVIDFAPAGVALDSLDGFFSASPDGRLFLTTRSAANRLVVVESTTQGSTWGLAAEGPLSGDLHYAISGQRRLTEPGRIIGSYTHSAAPGAVRFFSAEVGAAPPSPRDARLGVQYTASGSAPGQPLDNLFDGWESTAWVAASTPAEANNRAWVALDFGQAKRVSRLEFLNARAPYPASGPSDYAVSHSLDGVTWQPAAKLSASGGWATGGRLNLDVGARYLKLETTRINDGTGWALGLTELWAHGRALEHPGRPRLWATVSTSAAAPAYPADLAGDGDPLTLWVASLDVSGSNNTAWAVLDLGQVTRVERLRWESPAGAPYPASGPAHYRIETSIDGRTYTPAVQRAFADAVYSGDEPLGRTARYVRLATTRVNDGSGWALAFKELWVE